MWRAVIAMMHLDKIVMPHEINYALTRLKGLPLSEDQRLLLLDDMTYPVAVEEIFDDITHPQDGLDFFRYARELSWADGDMDPKEELMIKKLMMRAGVRDEDGGDRHVMVADAVRKLKDRRAESGILFKGKSAYR